MDSTVVFGHERLVAYQRACEFSRCIARVFAALPRGEGALADQLRRASDSVLLNLAEGAARTAPLDKARSYDIARGSGAECAAALELVAIRGAVPAAWLEESRALLHEVVRMLAGLASSARSRARP